MTDTLYKFAKPEGVSLLEQGTVKATPPNEFDDPFEFLPAIEKLSREETHQLLTRIITPSAGYTATPPYSSLPRDIQRKLLLRQYQNQSEKRVEIARRFVDTMSIEWRVLCLARNWGSVSMWSLYAERHTGFVAGFDPTALEKIVGTQPIKVDYGERPLFPGDPARQGQLDKYETYRKLVASKSSEWEYQREFRFLISKNKLEDGKIASKPASLLRFNAAALREVIFGAHCDICHELMELVKERYPCAKCFKAELHPTRFEIIKKPLR